MKQRGFVTSAIGCVLVAGIIYGAIAWNAHRSKIAETAKIQQYTRRVAELEQIEQNWRTVIERSQSNAAHRLSVSEIAALKAETEAISLSTKGQPLDALRLNQRAEMIRFDANEAAKTEAAKIRQLERATRNLTPQELIELAELRRRIATIQVDQAGR